MFTRQKSTKGFTMVELLVVLIIVGILAAVATPLYLANVQRARASEAVSAMGLIRQALRDYRINHETYYTIAVPGTGATAGNIQRAVPTSVGLAPNFTPVPATAGVGVDVGAAKYFSNTAYTSVDATTTRAFTASNAIVGQPTTPVDFVIRVNGNLSEISGCTTYVAGNNCATKNTEVATYRLEMDNSGRTFISYDSGTTWESY